MILDIVSYLGSADPDFDAGFALFCKYSRNRTAMDWISRRRDKAKLLYELGKLAGSTAPANPSASSDQAVFSAAVAYQPAPEKKAGKEPLPADVIKANIRTFDDRRTRRSELPPELQEVYDRNAEDYKLRRGFHEKMKMARTDADRAVFRQKVLETDARIQAGWKLIDDFFTRSAVAAVTESFNESTCRSYISKALHREKNSPKQVATCKARVAALLDHDCHLDEGTLEQLQKKGLI